MRLFHCGNGEHVNPRWIVTVVPTYGMDATTNPKTLVMLADESTYYVAGSVSDVVEQINAALNGT